MWSVFKRLRYFSQKHWASWCCRWCDYQMAQYKRLKGPWTKPTPQHNREIFVWPWNENARTKQKQQTNVNRAIWLVYRTETNARGFWLVKRTLGWKNFMPEELSRNEPILQHDWPIEQYLLHIRVFFGGKTKRLCFGLFIHWLIKQIKWRTFTETIFQSHTKIALPNSFWNTKKHPKHTNLCSLNWSFCVAYI